MRAEEFWSKVDRRGPDECWPWLGAIGTHGYGAVSFWGKRATASRLAFYFTHGRWPEPCGLHRCDNRPCCNPGHLYEGTQQQNLADMRAKGRGVRGVETGLAKLDPERVLAIYALRGKRAAAAVAREHGVCSATVERIFTRRTWAWLTTGTCTS